MLHCLSLRLRCPRMSHCLSLHCCLHCCRMLHCLSLPLCPFPFLRTRGQSRRRLCDGDVLLGQRAGRLRGPRLTSKRLGVGSGETRLLQTRRGCLRPGNRGKGTWDRWRIPCRTQIGAAIIHASGCVGGLVTDAWSASRAELLAALPAALDILVRGAARRIQFRVEICTGSQPLVGRREVRQDRGAILWIGATRAWFVPGWPDPLMQGQAKCEVERNHDSMNCLHGY
jgi:hypothetical protein